MSSFEGELGERTPQVVASSDRVFVDTHGAELYAFSLDGALVDTLSIPEDVEYSIYGLEDEGLVIDFQTYAFEDGSDELCRKQGLCLWQP